MRYHAIADCDGKFLTNKLTRVNFWQYVKIWQAENIKKKE